MLESDSKECILHLSHPMETPAWSIEGLIQDICSICIYSSICFLWVKREANATAHALAKWAFFCNFAGPVSFAVCPHSVFNVLKGDCFV